MTVQLEIKYTPHGFYGIDMDTGKELLCFERKYTRKTIVLCQYRHPRTKRYGRKVREFYIQYVAVFEACYEGHREGKGSSKANDLHIECHEYATFNPRNYRSIDDLLRDIEIASNEIQDSCDSCFAKFRKHPENEHICFRTKMANSKCYWDRCEENVGVEVEDLCKA